MTSGGHRFGRRCQAGLEVGPFWRAEQPVVPCACGCGEQREKYDRVGRARRFVPGHNNPAFRRPEET